MNPSSHNHPTQQPSTYSKPGVLMLILIWLGRALVLVLLGGIIGLLSS